MVFFLGFLFANLAVDAYGQRRLAPRPIPYSELEREEGERLLADMRRFGLPGVYSFIFEMRVLPRRGEEQFYHGQIWSGRNEIGPVSRIEIRHARDFELPPMRLFVQNGVNPAVWFFKPGVSREVERLSDSELFTPVKGTHFTPFDLQMPFLFWEEFEYEGLTRSRGRSSHAFLMHPPDDLAAEFAWLGGVRIIIDAEFRALTAAEIVDENGRAVKSIRGMEIKRLDGEWIPKTIEARDEVTRDRTRLSLQAAALNLPEDSVSFDPNGLGEPNPIITREQFSFF